MAPGKDTTGKEGVQLECFLAVNCKDGRHHGGIGRNSYQIVRTGTTPRPSFADTLVASSRE